MIARVTVIAGSARFAARNLYLCFAGCSAVSVPGIHDIAARRNIRKRHRRRIGYILAHISVVFRRFGIKHHVDVFALVAGKHNRHRAAGCTCADAQHDLSGFLRAVLACTAVRARSASAGAIRLFRSDGLNQRFLFRCAFLLSFRRLLLFRCLGCFFGRLLFCFGLCRRFFGRLLFCFGLCRRFFGRLLFCFGLLRFLRHLFSVSLRQNGLRRRRCTDLRLCSLIRIDSLRLIGTRGKIREIHRTHSLCHGLAGHNGPVFILERHHDRQLARTCYRDAEDLLRIRHLQPHLIDRRSGLLRLRALRNDGLNPLRQHGYAVCKEHRCAEHRCKLPPHVLRFHLYSLHTASFSFIFFSIVILHPSYHDLRVFATMR